MKSLLLLAVVSMVTMLYPGHVGAGKKVEATAKAFGVDWQNNKRWFKQQWEKFIGKKTKQAKSVFHGKEKVCDALKEEHTLEGIAKNLLENSPIENFGFPQWDSQKNKVVLNQKPIAVKLTNTDENDQVFNLDVIDFVFTGTKKEIIAFCDCLGHLTFQAKIPEEDKDSWQKAGTLKLQVENLQDAFFQGKDEKKTMLDVVAKRILDYASPKNKLIAAEPFKVLMDYLFDVKVMSIKKIFEQVKGVVMDIKIPYNDLKNIENAARNLNDVKSTKENLQLIKDEITNDIKALFKKKPAPNGWTGTDNLANNKGKYGVKITMYTTPENRVRASYDTKQGKINLRDVAKYLRQIPGANSFPDIDTKWPYKG